MSKTAFKIKPGRYDVPKVGRVDANEPVSDAVSLQLYRLPRKVFPWIEPREDAKDFLKKQKFTAEDVAQMIQNAQTVDEVEMLASLSDTKTVERMKILKIHSLRK